MGVRVRRFYKRMSYEEASARLGSTFIKTVGQMSPGEVERTARVNTEKMMRDSKAWAKKHYKDDPPKNECARCGKQVSETRFPYVCLHRSENGVACARQVHCCDQCLEQIGGAQNVRCAEHLPPMQ